MRIRFSLRALLIGMGVVAIAVWLGNWALTRVRSQKAISYCESRGFLRGYFADRDDWAIELDHAQMTPTDWQQLGQLGKIWEVIVNGESVVPAELSELLRQNKPFIRSLGFRYRTLSPDLAAVIGKCPRLESLHFYKVTEGPEPFAMVPLPKLREVGVLHSDVSDKSLAWIAKQRALEVVVIRYNPRATTAIVDDLLHCKALREIDFAQTPISADGMRRLLANLPLEQVAFPAVTLTEADVAAMASSKLTHIDLRHVTLSAPVLPLVECERVFCLHVSLAQSQPLTSSRKEISRKNRMLLYVHGLNRYEDVPAASWPPAMELHRESQTGANLFDPATGPGMPIPASN